jgi:hypothetical protein
MPTSNQLAALAKKIDELTEKIQASGASLPDWMSAPYVTDAVAATLAKLVTICWPGRKLDSPECPEDVEAALVEIVGEMLKTGNAVDALSVGYEFIQRWTREYPTETAATTEELP